MNWKSTAIFFMGLCIGLACSSSIIDKAAASSENKCRAVVEVVLGCPDGFTEVGVKRLYDGGSILNVCLENK